jgi:hypothetical protein
MSVVLLTTPQISSTSIVKLEPSLFCCLPVMLQEEKKAEEEEEKPKEG